jgi:hypothetical protein
MHFTFFSAGKTLEISDFEFHSSSKLNKVVQRTYSQIRIDMKYHFLIISVEDRWRSISRYCSKNFEDYSDIQGRIMSHFSLRKKDVCIS